MSAANPALPEVFTVHEVARAAGVPVGDVRALIAQSDAAVIGRRFVSVDDAIWMARSLKQAPAGERRERALFAAPTDRARPRSALYAASGALHGALLATFVLIASLGVRTQPTEQRVQEPTRLVFLATAGPGGGGGGGGLRQAVPAPRARTRGTSSLRSPVTVAPKVAREEPPKRVETPPPVVVEPTADPAPPPPPQPAPTPPVIAPVVSAPADADDRAGILTDTAASTPSNGPGAGGGTGIGSGTGIGEGTGAGIGAGSGAGIGGGPYRPGSGVAPPSLLREVKPIYTEEGRRRGIEGDVVMEVVVRADGTVGAVRIVQGLGSGLDQRAAEAVRQWRFLPARRFGSAVDVLVEVAVEFRLR